jgi:putative acetyltransferase
MISEKSKVQYHIPETEEDYNLVIAIFNEYQKYLNIDLCFQSFDYELDNLQKIYSQPKGIIILAKIGNEIAGCIALKPIEENNCEMKRLFVKPIYRGLGIGKKLVEMVINTAKNNHYEIMKLDTLINLNEAVELYKAMGFVTTAPYVHNPLSDVLYFEKKLSYDF